MQEKTHTYTIRTITELKPGDHLCQIYETEEEHRKLLMPYLIQGLRNNEKVFYIVDTHTTEVILEYLNSEGFDPKPYLDSGQFSIITHHESYTKDGSFDPDRMIELLRSETEKAIKEGYGALRVTGEMTWALRGLPGSEKLIEYEAKLNDFFPGSKALAISQYDRNQFSPEILLNILKTHPIAVIGTEICDNPFYVPAKAFLGLNVYGATLDSWTNNLLERKKAENEVRLSEEKFAKVFNDSPSAVFITTLKEGRFIEINKSGVNMFGYKLDEMVGRTSKELNLWADISDGNALILSLLKDGAVHNMEVRFRRKSGVLFPALISAGLIDVEGKRCLLSTVVDLTEHNEALKKIKLFSDAMQYSLNLVLTADLRGNMTYVNPAFEKVLGYSQEEAGKMKIADFLAEEEVERVEKIMMPAITNQGGYTGEAIARHKTGTLFPVEFVAYLFKDENNSAAICASFADISERKKSEEILRESEEKYRTVVEGALDGVCMIGGDYRFKYVNEKLAEIQGYSREELIGTDLRKYLDEESRTLLADRAAQRKEGIKLSAYFQLNIIRKDGEVKSTEISARNIKDSKGDVNTIVILKDITERKKAEESLRTSEARYRSYIELTGQIGWTAPAEGMVDDIPAWRKFTGQSIEEVKGWGWLKALHPDDVEHTKQVWDKAVETKTNYETEYRIRRYDGVYRDFVARGIPVLKEDRNIREWVGTCIDITERKNAEKELKASKANFLNIVENSIDGILVVDQQGKIHYVNPVAKSLFLGKKEELWGEMFGFPLVADEMVEIDIFRKNAEKGVAEMRAREIEWESKPAYLVSIRDVTETKETEQLKAAMDERRRIDKVKDDFISTVSHELRTPLTTIKEFTSIISDEIPGKLTKEQKEYLDIIKGNVDRLARLINDILDISKIESGRIGLARAVLDINKLAEDVISTLRPEADKKHIALKSLFHTPLPDVYIDPDKIVQVFTNLIENAIKFTPENGEITVEIKDKKKHIECSIADTGRGISPENLKKLFVRFQQFDRIHGPGAKGTGLGLAITKELIKLHNGTIWAKSKLDKGTKFIFTIPRETDLTYLKEILSSKIDRIASSGETLALLFIDIVNFNKLKEKWDKDSLVGLLATIKNITSSTLRKAEDVIFPLEQKRIAVIFTVKHMNDTKAVMDRLKSALQVRLFLKKDLEAEVTICMSAAIYGEHIDTVDKMIEGTSKIYDNIPISLIGKREVVVVDDEEVILKLVKSYLAQTGDFRVYA
ncbi:MAG: PAS domain S-box protein, partial [Flavisolibacter sp.]